MTRGLKWKNIVTQQIRSIGDCDKELGLKVTSDRERNDIFMMTTSIFMLLIFHLLLLGNTRPVPQQTDSIQLQC